MDKIKIKGILALIQRSPDIGDGWRAVSEPCWQLVEDMPLELIERDEDSSRVRMTSEGKAVLAFGV